VGPGRVVMSALIHRDEGRNVTYTSRKRSNGLIIMPCDGSCTLGSASCGLFGEFFT
jgi:hypothetical protein